MNEDMKLILDEIKGVRDELKAEIKAVNVRMDKLDSRMDKLDNRMDKLDSRMDKLEERVIKLDAKVDAHRADTVSGFDTIAKTLDVIIEKMNGMESITGRNMYDIALLKQKQA